MNLPTLRTMQIWHTAAAVFVFFIFMLAALSYLGGLQNRQKRQGFACRPNQDVALPALSTTFSSNKPEWVMLEVLRIKALMGKNAGCRKVADTFNRLHAPMGVGKSFVSDGRIKPLLKQLDIYSTWGLQNALNEIRQFFNHVRTHQNLYGSRSGFRRLLCTAITVIFKSFSKNHALQMQFLRNQLLPLVTLSVISWGAFWRV